MSSVNSRSYGLNAGGLLAIAGIHDGRDRSGLAIERHELDLEGLAVGVDVNDRPDIATLQPSAGTRSVSTTRSSS
jgi:hypothetical protein